MGRYRNRVEFKVRMRFTRQIPRQVDIETEWNLKSCIIFYGDVPEE